VTLLRRARETLRNSEDWGTLPQVPRGRIDHILYKFEGVKRLYGGVG
jgi:hypothetical protein